MNFMAIVKWYMCKDSVWQALKTFKREAIQEFYLFSLKLRKNFIFLIGKEVYVLAYIYV